MKKAEIDSILLINLYFTDYKLSKPTSPEAEVVRLYLLNKVNKFLFKKEPSVFTKLSKAFIILLIILVR